MGQKRRRRDEEDKKGSSPDQVHGNPMGRRNKEAGTHPKGRRRGLFLLSLLRHIMATSNCRNLHLKSLDRGRSTLSWYHCRLSGRVALIYNEFSG